MSTQQVIILGINGHIGHNAAKAFVAAGWDVTGYGRSNRHPIEGVRFVKGDADDVEALRAAIGEIDVVVNALNLPYHQWDNGRMEAQAERVLAALGKSGKTMLFPGNIYNYAATDRVVTPDLPQHPQTPRGAIRVQVEKVFSAAAQRGDIQLIILRAGDFYGPNNTFDWFDLAMLSEAGKGKLKLMGARGIGHAWAYLPDLGRAFEKLAWHRKELGASENFHFAGHYVTPEDLETAIVAAAPVRLKVSMFPRWIFGAIGLVNPMMREVGKMAYLWENPMELRDPRLDAILGPGFATPFDAAIKATVVPFFAAERKAA
ncbi:NAD-dependent epimerase/dehydratase family protein [Devosia sp. ZB163]|uniref:NAD-dependent epimerase/dehydratase family protein n=1 Tax=Devosia sp. ZB163 TaxID=3025938 RepID=UPI002361B92D|nr:NAD-dependent epimerase/dehydratase family protein [Devosia sp. ZB163]MDC9826459.1 NAD-dependent epimerase/dehydratase family protein [Devosia sp. ZB163]